MYRLGLALALGLAAAAPARAADDGSQLRSPFRLNYLGYFQHGPKIAVYLSAGGGEMAWSLRDAAGKVVASGTSRDHVAADFASGDSFFRIDFSPFAGVGAGFRLSVEGRESEPFDVSATSPWGALARESFDYFRDHRAPETAFDKFLHDWTKGRIAGPFWYDAGDKGSYPTNTAMAAWLLMNLYERYPAANASLGEVTIYEEVKLGAHLMHQLILPGQKLAIAKLHTNVPSWGPCPPHETGPCVSKTETKATHAMARTLAQLARLHVAEKDRGEARRAFDLARTALANARSEPYLCRDFPDFGGEGGIYPDHDVYALWREPRRDREPCHAGRDNVEDDAYAALVEVFLASRALGDPGAAALAREVVAHPRFGEIGEFWWMSVAPTANLSLLALRPEGIDLAPIRRSLYGYADFCARQMAVGYPGVSKDARSDRWDSGDRDEVDNNWRWGSNRMLLDDAVVLAYAAEEKAAAGDARGAARYAAHAIRVMDYILGTNAMALSMVTGFGEHAVERLHDPIVPDTEPGKMALGPNNWTNAGDPDMPPFGSLPGMKMMPVTGRGWAAREIAIDGNAPLVWVAWWAEHRAAGLLGGGQVFERLTADVLAWRARHVEAKGAAGAGSSRAAAPDLNCRDGRDAPPRLLLVQNLWGLRAYPSAADEWPDERKVREIRAAGFDAFDVWVGGATEGDLARWEALAGASGLGVGVEFGPSSVEDADAAIAAARRLGSVYLDAHVASYFTPEAEAEALLRGLVERCARAGMPLVVQTHRGRVTQDLLRTVAYARAIPGLRFDLDLSHYLVAGEMGGALSPAADAALSALMDRAIMLDGRVTNGQQVQVDAGNPAFRAHVERHAALWKRVMVDWLRTARRGDVFPFRVELGPPDYAILGPDGREISDRWEQQKALLALVERLWNEAVTETGVGERRPSR